MKVLTDNCVPGSVVDFLKKEGHDVLRIVDVVDPRTADKGVAQTADRLNAVLVTADRDFLSRKAFPPARHAGIIVLLDLDKAPDRVLRRLKRGLNGRDISGKVLVLDGRSARVHH